MRAWTVIVVAGLLAGGCAASGAKDTDRARPPASSSPAAPSPSATPTRAAFSAVTVTRSGGFAGVSDRYTVTTDGTITPGGRKLSPADLAQLRTLVTGAELAAEAERSPYRAPNCADGFNYSVVTGSLRLAGTDCGNLGKDAPTMMKVVQLVERAATTG